MGALARNGLTRTGALTRPARPNDGTREQTAEGLPERAQGAPGRSQKMTRAPSQQTARPDPNGRRRTKRPDPNGRPRTKRPDPTGRPHTARPTERWHKRANGKRAARTCTRHPGGHNLAKMIRAPSHETARPGALARNGPTRTGALTRRARPNDGTREQTAKGPPERAQGTRAVTT